MMEFTDFKKSYGQQLVLDICKASLPDGVYWLRGGNGIGKSTLLRSMAGMSGFKGQLTLNGLSMKKHGSAFRKTVNFAEAEPVYPEFLTGTELIGMFDQAKGKGFFFPDKLIADMQMTGYVESPIGSYSSGMLKKLSLALAFLGRPDWILLDEPLNALDVDAIKMLYQWIEQARMQRLNLILSSHQALDLEQIPGCALLDITDKNLFIR